MPEAGLRVERLEGNPPSRADTPLSRETPLTPITFIAIGTVLALLMLLSFMVVHGRAEGLC
jgi:hypothetical protein